jgi:CRP/FNR family transcriptional regulator
MNALPAKLLVSLPWLSAFPELAAIQDKAGLAALHAAKLQTFPAGPQIVRPGTVCESFMLLVRGNIRVYEAGESGREIALYRLNAGELCVLSLTSLMAPEAYSAGAMAEGEIDAAMIPLPQFKDALADSDTFRSFVLITLSRRLGQMMSLVEQVAFRQLDLRLAWLLGQLFGESSSPRLRVTHQELAMELGTSREVISRMLKEFERMGCISMGRGEIELLSRDTLSRLTNRKPV